VTRGNVTRVEKVKELLGRSPRSLSATQGKDRAGGKSKGENLSKRGEGDGALVAEEGKSTRKRNAVTGKKSLGKIKLQINRIVDGGRGAKGTFSNVPRLKVRIVWVRTLRSYRPGTRGSPERHVKARSQVEARCASHRKETAKQS